MDFFPYGLGISGLIFSIPLPEKKVESQREINVETIQFLYCMVWMHLPLLLRIFSGLSHEC